MHGIVLQDLVTKDKMGGPLEMFISFKVNKHKKNILNVSLILGENYMLQFKCIRLGFVFADIKKATKGFNSKNNCMSRTYAYLTPTFAFSNLEEVCGHIYK